MNLSIFEDNLDRYGGDLSTWPRDVRKPAADLLGESGEARSALQAMADVEGFLSASRPGAGGADRFAETASRQPQARPRLRTPHRAAWAAAAMIMLVLGLFVGDIRPVSDDGVDILMATSLEPLGTTDVD